MQKKIILLSLASLGLSATRASAQLVVSAPLLEGQSAVQTGLQKTMKGLEAAANKLVAFGVKEQELTKTFARKNLEQHKEWYDGLLKVSAAVRDYRRVRSIYAKQTQIIQQYSDAINVLRTSPYITPQQLTQMTSVYAQLLTEGANTVADLRTVVSPAMLKMTDAERMEFIDQLDAKITDQLGLVSYFTRRNMLQLRAAQQIEQDRQTLLSFMGSSAR
ncbi:hypothetical protein KLP40_17865 [Hymenobacter sp. NST-14]|uniref:hypothetical protein n=1 Tax=Hymenobacter piscis TaxID=2839984 RepID=UPI001C01B6CE|nr:hypothetical protein [Hymenobacter piscis]MBT9395038.1 hypothetical protein [Hymenobacter piscis]